MFTNKLASIALLAVVPLTAASGIAMADAGQAPVSTITAKPSDKTPASGQEFNVAGRFTIGQRGAADHVVRVQSKLNGSWQALPGAQERTNGKGKYSIELELNSKGDRLLRVVGVGQGSQSNARKQFSVTVH